MSRSRVTLTSGRLSPACNTCGAIMPRALGLVLHVRLGADLAQDLLRTTVTLTCRCNVVHVAHVKIVDVDLAGG